jgi:hypothetical protein
LEDEEGVVEQVTVPVDLATATNPPAEDDSDVPPPEG